MLFAQIAHGNGCTTVDAHGHELDFVFQDHAPTFGHGFLNLAAHVCTDQLERTPFETPSCIGFVDCNLKSGANGIGNEGKAATVNIDQTQFDGVVAAGRLSMGRG